MRKGQATVELAVALILIVILLMAGVKTFLWLNEGMVARQVSYENTRIEAGSTAPAEVVLNNDLGEVGFDEPFNEEFNIFTTSD